MKSSITDQIGKDSQGRVESSFWRVWLYMCAVKSYKSLQATTVVTNFVIVSLLLLIIFSSTYSSFLKILLLLSVLSFLVYFNYRQLKIKSISNTSRGCIDSFITQLSEVESLLPGVLFVFRVNKYSQQFDVGYMGEGIHDLVDISDGNTIHDFKPFLEIMDPVEALQFSESLLQSESAVGYHSQVIHLPDKLGFQREYIIVVKFSASTNNEYPWTGLLIEASHSEDRSDHHPCNTRLTELRDPIFALANLTNQIADSKSYNELREFITPFKALGKYISGLINNIEGSVLYANNLTIVNMEDLLRETELVINQLNPYSGLRFSIHTSDDIPVFVKIPVEIYEIIFHRILGTIYKYVNSGELNCRLATRKEKLVDFLILELNYTQPSICNSRQSVANICKSLVELDVQTVSGRFITDGVGVIEVWLPMHRICYKEETEQSNISVKRKVLIADDDQTVANSIAQMLRARDIQVTITTNGQSALNALRHSRYDAAFIDYHMSYQKGDDVVRQAKNTYLNDTEFFLMTSDKDVVSESNIAHLFSDVLIKPISSSKLFALLGFSEPMHEIRQLPIVLTKYGGAKRITQCLDRISTAISAQREESHFTAKIISTTDYLIAGSYGLSQLTRCYDEWTKLEDNLDSKVYLSKLSELDMLCDRSIKLVREIEIQSE